MVYDFSDIKRSIQSWIDRELDHKMILCRDDTLVKALTDLTEPFFVMEANPTAENIARLIYDYAVSQSFPVREVRLWETPTSFAAYGPDA